MPLSRKQLEDFEKLARARLAALTEEIRGDVARSREDSYGAIAGPVTDSADEAAAHLLADLDRAEITRDLGEARALEAALERLADGSYGACSDCGLDIAPARLHANPAAMRCVECQRVHEKTFAHAGEPKL